MTNQLFDNNILHNTTSGDKTIELALLERFETTVNNCLMQLNPSLPDKQWQNILHELAGASLAIGATALAKACDMGMNNLLDKSHFLSSLHKLANETKIELHNSLAQH